MILHLVTDRKRLAPAADDTQALACLLDQARFAIAAGIDVIQVRERDLDGGALADLVKRLVALARGTGTRVLVNDRLDVALAAGADGVHLRGDSFDAVRVRRCAPADFIVGRSVRTADEARAAGPVDYLIAGTVWPTRSKTDAVSLLGADGLRAIAAAVPVPVIGIGGIAPGRAADLARAGAAGAAGIGVWMGEGSGCRAVPLHDLAHAFRAGFDAANMGRPFTS